MQKGTDVNAKLKVKIFKIMTGIILISLIFFFYWYDVKIEFGIKPVTTKPPVISFLIMSKVDDQTILIKLRENPSLMNEECPNEHIDLKSPLISAIAFERKKLANYMIRNGVDIERNIKLLELEGKEGQYYIQKVNELIKN